DHYTTSAKTLTSPIPANSTITVEQFWQSSVVPKYLWGKTYTGWFVIGELLSTGTMDWWVYGVTNTTELCDEVPGWPAGLSPPSPLVSDPFTGTVRAGIHFAWFSDHTKAAQTAPYIGI